MLFCQCVSSKIATIGYRLLPWQVLNAKDYGVPQSRERLFLIGAKQGIPLPHYPTPTASRPNCADALGDLPNAEGFEELLKCGEVTVRYKSAPQNAYAADLRCMSAADWHYGHRRCWRRSLLTNSIRTNHSPKSRARFRRTLPGTREPVSRFYRLSAEGISTTLRAGTDATRGAFTSPRPIHYRYARCVTVREMARLHSFPDWFRLHNTKWHGARQVGNSVPPLLARAIASELMQALDCRPIAPTRNVRLGDEGLLTMTVPAASDYWGVKNPIPPRGFPGTLNERNRRYGYCQLNLFAS